jgi:undecaprenyl-diphosphatase
MKYEVKSLLAKVSLKLVAVMILFSCCLGVFLYIANEVVLENETTFDFRIIAFVAAHSTASLISFMTFISFFGSSSFLLPCYILLIGYFLYKKNKAYAIDIAILAITSTGLMFLLKNLFHRHRPIRAVGHQLLTYSFPSGHSVSSFIFCTILAYLVWISSFRKGIKLILIFALFLFSMLIGISRIVLNVHFATDVIAGFCFGLVWVLLSFVLMRWIRSKKLVK